MANNFRIAGNSYFSKGGHDTNDGLTPDSPKKTITGGTGLRVIGTGFYVVNNNMPDTVIGDGEVVVDFANTARSILQGTPMTQTNITYQNAISLNTGRNPLNNVTFKNISSLIGDYINVTQVQNTVRYITCSGGGRNLTFAANIICIDSSLIFNQFAGGFLKNSYFDFASVLSFSDKPRPSGFHNNNVQGIMIIDSVKYAIQDQFIGTPQDNGYTADVYWLNEANLTANGYTGTIAGWDAAVATCINRDPKFNNTSKLDFTLQADSPHIGRASDSFNNIGGTEYAQSFYAGISNPNILLFEASEAIDTTTNNNDWRLKPGYNEGWIRAIIKVSNNDVQISSIPYIGNYSFDSDQLGGSSTNMNVPDSKPITNEYPNYLTVTTQAANDTTLIIAGHGAVVGDWLWVDGQYREITGVPDADTVTFATSLRAIVIVGTVVKIGTFESLASLNPNRLNMKMRSSKLAEVNASNWDNPSTWDNDGLSPSGQYMAQEWNNAPMIDSLNNVGFGDDNYDANYGNPINLKVVDIMIYLRNNYRS